MKDIVFVFNAGCFPVPAINGGAVESLINVLIDQNEVEQKYNFHIIMCKNTEDKTNYDYSNYKYTKFYDYYQSTFKFKKDRIVNGVNKRLNYFLPLYSSYEKYILNTIDSIKPDFIIFEGSFNATVRKLAKKYDKDKLVLHVHHRILPKYKIGKYFGRMFSVSEYIKRDWQESNKLPKDFKYQILNNVLTSTTFSNKQTEEEKKEIKTKLGIKDDDFVVIFCGRLIPEKGIDVLIKAIKGLNNDKIKLVIVGESAFKNSQVTPFVEQLRDLVGDSKDIVFTGFVPNNELYKYYSIANLHVISSVWPEAAGIVALESRAVGIPQIITRAGGLVEYANPNAVVVEVNDQLENSLKTEINNFYNGKYDISKFSSEYIAGGKEYYKQFDEIIND